MATVRLKLANEAGTWFETLRSDSTVLSDITKKVEVFLGQANAASQQLPTLLVGAEVLQEKE